MKRGQIGDIVVAKVQIQQTDLAGQRGNVRNVLHEQLHIFQIVQIRQRGDVRDGDFGVDHDQAAQFREGRQKGKIAHVVMPHVQRQKVRAVAHDRLQVFGGVAGILPAFAGGEGGRPGAERHGLKILPVLAVPAVIDAVGMHRPIKGDVREIGDDRLHILQQDPGFHHGNGLQIRHAGEQAAELKRLELTGQGSAAGIREGIQVQLGQERVQPVPLEIQHEMKENVRAGFRQGGGGFQRELNTGKVAAFQRRIIQQLFGQRFGIAVRQPFQSGKIG